MPSIIPGFEYDIFISYRHNDNKSGWVTEFVKALEEELAATVKDPLTIYFDKNPHDGLLETHNVDKSLEGKLKCLIFIPIVSQTYCDPKSFAWTHEFVAFNQSSKEDQFGRDVKLGNGNVASRILPVRIHELDEDDKSTIEREIGGPLRAIEFIYKQGGVNRPLNPKDDEVRITGNVLYRDQVNKVANAVKGIIVALKDPTRKVQSTAIVGVRRRVSMARKITIALIAMLMTVLAGIAYQRSLTLSSPPLDKSIAVLPFADMSPSHDQEYFCDGVAEEIINVLAQVRGLKVIARSSSFQFKGRNEDLKKVGQLLGVSTVLEGSIRKSSEKIRVTAQLINTSDGSHLWSKTFERTASDIFSIQDEIAAAISESLEATLSPSDKEIRERWDEAAWKDYQLGRFYYDRGGVGDEAIARNYFKNSVTKDSTHSISWSYLATLNLLTSTWGEAERSNAIALQLDSSNVEAWVNHAYFSIYREFNHRTATVILQRVMRAEKSAKTLRNINSILNTLGRTREGIPYGLQAIELDPLQPRAFDYLERSYYQLRNFDSANFYYNKLFQISPQFRGTFIMRYKMIYAKIDSYLAQGNWIEAEKLLPQNNEPISLSYWSVTSYMKGDKRASDKYLRELKQIAADEKEFYLTNYFIAIAHCFRKENEDALSALEKSLEKREVMLTGRIKNEPVLDPLRKEPRFIKMVKYLDREDPE